MRVTWASAGLVFALTMLVMVQVLRTATDHANTSAAGYVPAAMTALAVLLVVFAAGALIRRFELDVSAWFAWLIGLVSFAFAFVPWLLLSLGHTDSAAMLYRGLRIPQGIERFWDLALVLRSIDCSAVGVDVFAQHNGCLQDPAIYGPGMLWLKYVPFGVFSFSHVLVLGVLMMLATSLALVWLARESTGVGQVVLFIAALGAPWLLLLERGNIDAVLIWVAVVAVILVRRWPTLWAWSIAAALIWLVGTWKYYPFAMGVLLLPVLWIRRGWIVLTAYVIASLGFVLLTWSNFRFSMQSNSRMTEIGDYVVLGRAPVVARMIGSVFPAPGVQVGDLIVAALAMAALAWGVLIGYGVAASRSARSTHLAMLAAAGSAMFLASVLVGGFGWAYKAAFLLLCVPLVSWMLQRHGRLTAFAGLVVLALIAVCSIVVWNTLLASVAGIIAAAFAAGLSVVLLLLRDRAPSDAAVPVDAAG